MNSRDNAGPQVAIHHYKQKQHHLAPEKADTFAAPFSNKHLWENILQQTENWTGNNQLAMVYQSINDLFSIVFADFRVEKHMAICIHILRDLFYLTSFVTFGLLCGELCLMIYQCSHSIFYWVL